MTVKMIPSNSLKVDRKIYLKVYKVLKQASKSKI